MAKTPRRPASRRARTRPPDRETEQRILDAARAVFIRRGTAGARMQEIAAEAGVNQALLHYYFRSKERLSTAVFQQAVSRVFPPVIQVLGGDLPIPEKIDRIVALYLENLAANPFVPGYILSELHNNPERVAQMMETAIGYAPGRALPTVIQKLERQMAEEVAAGRMRPISAMGFAVNLLSLSIFPFAARPMLSIAFQMDDAAFARFIAVRRTELVDFIRNAIRP